jgi:hypothetical protein
MAEAKNEHIARRVELVRSPGSTKKEKRKKKKKREN